MFTRSMLSFALACAGCAAEHLDARDPNRGPTAAQGAPAPIVRPTDLNATEKQIVPAPDPESHPVSPNASKTPAPDNKSVYVCPMHAEVRSDKPGACPKCGMKLQLHEHGQ